MEHDGIVCLFNQKAKIFHYEKKLLETDVPKG